MIPTGSVHAAPSTTAAVVRANDAIRAIRTVIQSWRSIQESCGEVSLDRQMSEEGKQFRRPQIAMTTKKSIASHIPRAYSESRSRACRALS